MSIQLSANSFLQMLRQSGLLTVSQRQAVEQHLDANGEQSAAEISDWLVQEEYITPWQSEKLLQARYRGFFLGPYRLLNRIARGGMSSIYSARNTATNELHALKVLPPTRTAKASYLPRFRREAEMTQRLVHPNIVRVFGVYEENDGQNPVHFMAMELLEGRDLFEIVNQHGAQPILAAVDYILQAARGLDYAHRHGLVHRDIKPGNLFLTRNGTIRILDLGLAQDFDSEENLTRDFNDRVLGTADYLAPEQAADSHTVDARADLYSLGCTLFFLLTGRPPYIEGTLVQRLVAHQTKSPPPLTDFRTDVPDPLSDLLRLMMARNRQDRIDSAALVAERLQGILAELHQTASSNDISRADASFPAVLSVGPMESEDATESRTLQKDVETATASTDDSWPDELWQAIAEAAEIRNASHATTEEAAGADPDKEHSDINGEDSPSIFEEYLQNVENRLSQDSDLSSDRRAAVLASFVRELRLHSLPDQDLKGLSPAVDSAVTEKIKDSEQCLSTVITSESRFAPSASNEKRSSFDRNVLILTVILAALAIAATRL